MLRVDIREPDHRSLETHSPASCKADKNSVLMIYNLQIWGGGGGGRWVGNSLDPNV